MRRRAESLPFGATLSTLFCRIPSWLLAFMGKMVTKVTFKFVDTRVCEYLVFYAFIFFNTEGRTVRFAQSAPVTRHLTSLCVQTSAECASNWCALCKLSSACIARLTYDVESAPPTAAWTAQEPCQAMIVCVPTMSKAAVGGADSTASG